MVDAEANVVWVIGRFEMKDETLSTYDHQYTLSRWIFRETLKYCDLHKKVMGEREYMDSCLLRCVAPAEKLIS